MSDRVQPTAHERSTVYAIAYAIVTDIIAADPDEMPKDHKEYAKRVAEVFEILRK
jgi:hypothetical protein